MALPASTREALRALLNIPKSGSVEVSTTGGSESILVSDGVTASDLSMVTRELLISTLGEQAPKDAEFPILWKLVVQKADLNLSVVDKPVSTGDNSAVIEKKNEEANKEASAKAEGAVSGDTPDKPEGGEATQTPA